MSLQKLNGPRREVTTVTGQNLDKERGSRYPFLFSFLFIVIPHLRLNVMCALITRKRKNWRVAKRQT